MRKTKMLLINNGYPSEKYPNYTTWVATIEYCLTRAGFDVDLLVIKHHNYYSNLQKIIKYITYFFRLATKKMSDYYVVYINYPTHAIPIFLNRTLNIEKVYCHWHGFDLIGNGAYTKFARKCMKSRFKRCIHFVPSNHYKEILINEYGLNDTDVVVSPSGGVNTELFKLPDDMRHKKNKERFVIGYASGLIGNKGVALLYEIMRKYKYLKDKINKNIEFNIINYSEEAEKYIGLMKNDKLPVNIWAMMEKKNMVKFYESLDLLIMPSPSESLGLVVLEAMSCNIPVVTFDICAFPDFVISKLSGERVKHKKNLSEDVYGFLDAIISVNHYYDSYSPRSIVLEKYSQDTVVENYRQIFSRM